MPSKADEPAGRFVPRVASRADHRTHHRTDTAGPHRTHRTRPPDHRAHTAGHHRTTAGHRAGCHGVKRCKGLKPEPVSHFVRWLTYHVGLTRKLVKPMAHHVSSSCARDSRPPFDGVPRMTDKELKALPGYHAALARKEVCPPRHVGGLPWHVTTTRVDGLTPVAPTLQWLDDASIIDHHQQTRGDK